MDINQLVGLQLNEAIDVAKKNSKTVRVLRADQENFITADFDPNRIDVYINEENEVVSV